MTALDRESALRVLRDLLRVRRFEERCAELYSQGKIRGFLHLYIGEEAVSAGVMPLLLPSDAVVASYREHGHALLRGLSARSLMAEMFGKKAGCCRGRGGSMHLFDASLRFYGGNAIVAGHLPMAVGLALADSLTQQRRVTACFFGDGAVAEGEFHEAMNLAQLWRLPVLFVCENNLYAMGTALARHQAMTDLARKAEAYAMLSAAADGMDVEAVTAAADRAIAHVREGLGPFFLELRTYRFRAHSMFDAELYRSKEEVAIWEKRDPLVTFTARARALGALNDGGLEALEREVKAELDDAVAFADAAEVEPPEELAWRVSLGGRA
jgi:pyruvate dehydrogenase E1 component alpha subunit/2-oxoisovalerate dehydrogenase E1 component